MCFKLAVTEHATTTDEGIHANPDSYREKDTHYFYPKIINFHPTLDYLLIEGLGGNKV